MSQHDYVLDNQSGYNFRQDLNNCLNAIATINSGTSAPTTTYAYQLWADTLNGLLKMRNSANNGWLTIGTLAANLGLQVAGNYVGFDASTGAATLPAGTTAQRPASPAAGQFRFNSTAGKFEGYNGSAWGSVGGASGSNGNGVFYENDQAVTADYTLSSGKNAMSAGPIDVNSGVTVTIPSGSTWAII